MVVRVEQDVLEVLARSTVAETFVQLPDEQLERKLYMRVAKALEACGFKWDRYAKHHKGQGSEAVDQLMLTGTYTDAKREFDAFYTPDKLADYVIERADIGATMSVLEPSAGLGALALRARPMARRVVCVERDSKSATALIGHGFETYCQDFLEFEVGDDFSRWSFDRAVMNPPFSRSQDAKHVLHALKFLHPQEGRLLAIMANSFTFRKDGAYGELHRELESWAYRTEKLPEGSFKESGTGVNTILLEVRRFMP